VVEVFGNSDPASEEAQVFLGESAVVTDRDGKATFTARVDRQIGDPRLSSITATVTSTEGATSPLSKARVLDASASAAGSAARIRNAAGSAARNPNVAGSAPRNPAY
jgi:hypothetical protein